MAGDTLIAGAKEEWASLQQEYEDLENVNKSYNKVLEEMTKLQNSCSKSIGHHKYRMKQISNALKQLDSPTPLHKHEVDKLQKSMAECQENLKNMEAYLPRTNGLYLKVILGNVNVTLTNKDDRFRYKEEYERFKLVVTTIILFLSFLSIVFNYRAIDSVLHFLLVWYYCTLTIRESILAINGSRIKGWWRIHHFITTVQAGVIIVWPDGVIYNMFRRQFMWYVCYTSFVQYLQFRYQQGCLYRLRSLGERHNMDITIEGFHSWMWRGLSFVIPFLYIVYIYQLYNAYTLYHLSRLPQCIEWQVSVSGVIFLLLFLGNIFTTSVVIHQKLREKLKLKELGYRKKQ